MIRLEKLAAFVPHCQGAVDVGCDHGYLAAMLVERGIANRVIACDISRPSLDKAAKLASERNLPIETRCGDGLTVIDAGEAEVAIIAGMGGYEILHILSDPRRKDGITRYVVSPHSDLCAFRSALGGLGLRIERETAVREGKHYYIIMELTVGTQSLSPLECEFGLGLRDPSEDFKAYLEWRLRLFERKVRTNGEHEELRREIDKTRAALECVAAGKGE